MEKLNEPVFVGSFEHLGQCPKEDKPEYAFIGRSNVGKSSLINMLADHNSLAKVSGQPGKTAHLNFFLIERSWYIVDLPGYGYARQSKSIRKAYQGRIEQYLSKRPTLQCAFLLVDSCVTPQKVDLEFANWMGEEGIPFVIVFTKSDRKKKGVNLKSNIRAFEKEMLKSWEEMPQYIVTSSVTGEGRDAILNLIANVNAEFKL